jgi:hypothetical protein
MLGTEVENSLTGVLQAPSILETMISSSKMMVIDLSSMDPSISTLEA